MAKKNPSAKRPRREKPLPDRIETALRQGKLGEAIDLARQLAREQPGPASRELLRRAYLRGAEHHVAADSFRDAHRLLTEAEQLTETDPAWWERLAELRADLGDWPRALELLERVPGTTARTRVLGHAADRALRLGDSGREALPEDLRPGFDLIRAAFAHHEAGRDEAAKEALQGVGLQSPFLEWKLLLRGLMAYAGNDDPRAVENWQRLAPGRLPARLAAPLRFAIDRAFREAQPAEAANVLHVQGDRLLGGGLVGPLRSIQALLGQERGLPQAFRLAEPVVQTLKRTNPDLAARLGTCFYWAIVHNGQPEDMPRYQRLFGPPADDPRFERLQALVTEQIGRLDEAHKHWRAYEEWIAAHAERWPGAQADRARAMVWERMGANAAEHLEGGGDDELGFFFDFFGAPPRRAKPKPLKPSTEECLAKAVELAPDWPEPTAQLFRLYAEEGKEKKAEDVARKLLESHPAHLPTLEALADLNERRGKTAEALAYARRALQVNPLDRRLRGRLTAALLAHARAEAEKKKFDAARELLREAREHAAANQAGAVLCLEAITERKAGDTERADSLQAEALAAPNQRLATVYRLAVEAGRIKLPPKAKKPFDEGLKAAFAGAATVPEAVALADAFDAYRGEPAPYRGLKTHEKKVQGLVLAALKGETPETPLIHVGYFTQKLGWFKITGEVAAVGQKRYPENPTFPFLAIESLVGRSPDRAPVRKLIPLVRRVLDLLDKEPGSERTRVMREAIDRLCEVIPSLSWYIQSRSDRPGGFNPFDPW